jgi:FeS assembly SUF system regulator
MIRISKLTDYSIVLLSHLASQPDVLVSTRDLSEATRLPLPTVEKLLKKLTASDLLVSERGVHGGYRLARRPGDVSIADVITALEGPIALTQCSSHADACGLESICPTKAPWRKINEAVLGALRGLSLAEMTLGHIPAQRSTKAPALKVAR